MPSLHLPSYISRLPNELLLEIFRIRDSPNEIPLPIRVSQVCRHWRKLSLNATLIWSQIDLSWHPMKMVKTCMERAGPYPLDIHIVLDDYSRPRCHSIKEGLDLIIPEIERWRSLTVDAQQFGSLMTVFAAIRHQYAPELTSIAATLDDTLGLSGLWHQSENSYLGILGGGAPKLTSLELCGVSLHYCHPPLESLKRLTLSAPCDSEAGLPLSYPKLRDVLQAALGLEELALQGRVVCHQESRNRDKVDSIVVPRLRRLDVSAPGGESAEYQCEYISSICRIVHAPLLSVLSTGFMGKLDQQENLEFTVTPAKQEAWSLSTSPSRVSYASILPRPVHQVDISGATFDAMSKSGNPLLFRASSLLDLELTSLSRLLVFHVDSVRLQRILDMLSLLSSEREERSWRNLHELIICSL